MEQGPATTSSRWSRWLQNVHDLAARVEDGGGGRFGDGHLLFQEDRRQNDFCGPDAQIVGAIEHGLSSV